jgi:hypothetical protein
MVDTPAFLRCSIWGWGMCFILLPFSLSTALNRAECWPNPAWTLIRLYAEITILVEAPTSLYRFDDVESRLEGMTYEERAKVLSLNSAKLYKIEI